MRPDFADPNALTAFVVENTAVHEVPLVPEIRLRLADEAIALWQLTEKELSESPLPPPYWAFAWAGGQALARYLLDTPGTVSGKTVLDFASGCGIGAIAARLAGAERVVAADIDPLAVRAAEINAALNGVEIETTVTDLVGADCSRWDVIVTGDICYEQPLADQVTAWLQDQVRKGALVLIGDPGRNHLPRKVLEKLVSYAVKTSRDLEDTDVRNTAVWRLQP